MSGHYAYFMREVLSPSEVGTLGFDLFISAFNNSPRVSIVFDTISASRKVWCLHSEYGVDLPPQYDSAEVVKLVAGAEIAFELGDMLAHLNVPSLASSARIGIDITGFMRPHLMVLSLLLHRAGFERVSYLYSDPTAYAQGSSTTFSRGAVGRVSSVPGFEGIHSAGHKAKDVLVIGAGYDEKLVRSVADFKSAADHRLLFGLPSLQPHMYQESHLRMAVAESYIHNYADRAIELYAPADNPFMTAAVLSEHVQKIRYNDPNRNVFLSPVGPKTQALGFAVFYMTEQMGAATSIIFPSTPKYSSDTSTGFSRLHVFDVETNLLASI